MRHGARACPPRPRGVDERADLPGDAPLHPLPERGRLPQPRLRLSWSSMRPSVLGSGDANVVENAIDRHDPRSCRSNWSESGRSARKPESRSGCGESGRYWSSGTPLQVLRTPRPSGADVGPRLSWADPCMRLWDIDLGRLPGPLGQLGKKEIHLWRGPGSRTARGRRSSGEPRRWGRAITSSRFCRTTTSRCTARSTWTAGWRGQVNEQGDFATPKARTAPRRRRSPPASLCISSPASSTTPDSLQPLAKMCTAGLGEVEVHLHHDGDTRDTLRAGLEKTLVDLGRLQGRSTAKG